MTPPIFLINLDRDADRLEHMTGLLDAAGLAFERVPAVLGTALPAHLADYLLTSQGEIASKLKRGEVGCYGSHLVIHDRMVRDGIAPAALVLEDDLRFGPELAPLLDRLIAALPDDWDIVRLSNPPKRAYVPIAALGDTAELVRYSKIPNNTGAYLISARGARKFLEGQRPRKRAVDEDMRRPWDFGLKTYGVVPPPIVSNIFDSRIDAIEDRGLAMRGKPPKVLTGKTEGLIGGLRRMAYNMNDVGIVFWFRCLWRNIANALGERPDKSAKIDAIVRRYRIG